MTRTQITRRRVLGTGAGTVAAALAGCLVSDGPEIADDGTDGESDTPADSKTPVEDSDAGQLGTPAKHVEVTMASVPRPMLDPGVVHIEPGGTVTWVGQGTRNAVASYHPEIHGPQRIPDGGVTWQSQLLREGTRFEVTFDQPGIYDYADTTELCGTHETYGIVGRVVVGWPDPSEEPAVQQNTEELPGLATKIMNGYNRRCRELLSD